MSDRCRPLAVALAALALSAPAPGAESARPPDPARVLERVWYRNENRPIRPYKDAGDVVVRGDGLEFRHRGNRPVWFLPWSAVRLVTIARMKGDLDTDWVVLVAEGSEAGRLVALRDGRKMGYGRNTPEMFARIAEAARAARAGQYALPDGFAAFERLRDQVVLGVPDGWRARAVESVYEHGKNVGGVVRFEPVAPAAAGAFDLVRQGAPRGSTCEGLSRATVDALVRELAAAAGVAPVSAETEVDRCHGVRLTAGGEGGPEWVAAAHGQTLYILKFGTAPPHALPAAEARRATVVGSVRFNPTR